jgi:hypothetical protein
LAAQAREDFADEIEGAQHDNRLAGGAAGGGRGKSSATTARTTSPRKPAGTSAASSSTEQARLVVGPDQHQPGGVTRGGLDERMGALGAERADDERRRSERGEERLDDARAFLARRANHR